MPVSMQISHLDFPLRFLHTAWPCAFLTQSDHLLRKFSELGVLAPMTPPLPSDLLDTCTFWRSHSQMSGHLYFSSRGPSQHRRVVAPPYVFVPQRNHYGRWSPCLFQETVAPCFSQMRVVCLAGCPLPSLCELLCKLPHHVILICHALFACPCQHAPCR